MADTEGHFQIGDLSFTFQGSIRELAHVQEIIREIRQAEYDLMQAADNDPVYLIYDDDLQGERGTFDKMRLRVYKGQKSYTIDLGVTDTNPLGIYVAHDAPIKVYDYEHENKWHLNREGERLREV